jgi:hypothetical protein
MKNKFKNGKKLGKKEDIRIDKVETFPSFCDYGCRYAKFTSPDAIGACRRDLAVYCTRFKKHNNKNARCFGSKNES